MSSLIAKVRVALVADCQSVQSSLLRPAQITFQFRNVHILVPVGNVHSVVIVEKQGAVMIEALHIMLLPRSFHRLRCVEVGLVRIVCHKADIEFPLVIPQGRRPHALSVDALIPLKPLRRSTVEHIIHIGRVLPVTQVIGAQDFAAGHKMHRGADHIIGVFDSDDIHVRVVKACDGIDRFQFPGQFTDLVDHFADCLYCVRQRRIRCNVNSRQRGKSHRIKRAARSKHLFPIVYRFLSFLFNPLADLRRHSQPGTVGIGIQSHVVMRLAHPCQFRALV